MVAITTCQSFYSSTAKHEIKRGIPNQSKKGTIKSFPRAPQMMIKMILLLIVLIVLLLLFVLGNISTFGYGALG